MDFERVAEGIQRAPAGSRPFLTSVYAYLVSAGQRGEPLPTASKLVASLEDARHAIIAGTPIGEFCAPRFGSAAPTMEAALDWARTIALGTHEGWPAPEDAARTRAAKPRQAVAAVRKAVLASETNALLRKAKLLVARPAAVIASASKVVLPGETDALVRKAKLLPAAKPKPAKGFSTREFVTTGAAKTAAGGRRTSGTRTKPSADKPLKGSGR